MTKVGGIVNSVASLVAIAATTFIVSKAVRSGQEICETCAMSVEPRKEPAIGVLIPLGFVDRRTLIVFVGSCRSCAMDRLRGVDWKRLAKKGYYIRFVEFSVLSKKGGAKPSPVGIGDVIVTDFETATKLNAVVLPRAYVLDRKSRLENAQPLNMSSKEFFDEI